MPAVSVPVNLSNTSPTWLILSAPTDPTSNSTFSKGHNIRWLKLLWAIFCWPLLNTFGGLVRFISVCSFSIVNLLPHQSSQFLKTMLTINCFIDDLYSRKSPLPTNVTMISPVLYIINWSQLGTHWHMTYLPKGFGRHKTINTCWLYHVDHTHFTAELAFEHDNSTVATKHSYCDVTCSLSGVFFMLSISLFCVCVFF